MTLHPHQLVQLRMTTGDTVAHWRCNCGAAGAVVQSFGAQSPGQLLRVARNAHGSHAHATLTVDHERTLTNG